MSHSFAYRTKKRRGQMGKAIRILFGGLLVVLGGILKSEGISDIGRKMLRG